MHISGKSLRRARQRRSAHCKKLREAINHYLDIASDQSNRESAQQNAMARVMDIIVDREKQNVTDQESHIPGPCTDGESRFKEHFSREIHHGLSGNVV